MDVPRRLEPKTLQRRGEDDPEVPGWVVLMLQLICTKCKCFIFANGGKEINSNFIALTIRRLTKLYGYRVWEWGIRGKLWDS